MPSITTSAKLKPHAVPGAASRPAGTGGAGPVLAMVVAGLFLGAAGPVYAHAEQGVAGGLVSGFLHPILGFDHLVAMVAVGLWGAQLRAPAIWVLPVAFPLVMTMGALIGVAGVPLPLVEIGVSISAIVLGAVVLARVTPALPVAAAIVSIFAVFHGYAHGAELPHAVNALAYGIGFVVSTGTLHACGIVVGLLENVPRGTSIVRGCGAVVAIVGVVFLCVHAGWLG